MAATSSAPVPAVADRRSLTSVIGASSAGTIIEWYDFYLFGSLATIIAAKFYPSGSEMVGFLKTLATFAAGFAVRPFGALVFGRIGDMVGRKYAFMLTLLIMGGSTAVIGILPGHETIGMAAPIILVSLRLLQGLALGGEYGGAAVYVAEHSPPERRGFYTSFIQTTATLGLFLSLIVILLTRRIVGQEAFADWGWRIPFLLSVLLVGLSYYIRRRMQESPVFLAMKAQGTTSKAPIKDSYGSAARWKVFFLVLIGATAGQAVVWYTGQFYALFFLQTTLRIDSDLAYVIIAVALALGTPFFLVFGALSDRIGRKRVMMAGNLIAAVAYYPIYKAMHHYAQPGEFSTAMLILLVFIQVIFVTMVYGPIAAFLVEAFPARIRYTSLSLPYHFGNGWFGGFLPFIATAMVARTGNIYAGLWYPIGVALLTFVVGGLYLKDNTGGETLD